ncbi:hypothetical protein [Natronoglomus mannanivorans]|uniref:Uncharacterized protein n=1 Tax=Natronoglomus mannanivorans TaxID=2979990 RepID=A0AAP3E2A8_9EURY|nr:hypothetical protein [Halobacteria archaeon AArc-xg1-1]
MTNGPQLRLGKTLLPGILAVALFGIIALTVLSAEFGEMAGFPDVTITEQIGYAMFDLTVLQSTEGNLGATEQFLAAFFLAAIVLDAALDASLVLAKREEGGKPVTALSSTEAGSTRSGEDARPATDGGRDGSGGDDA